MLLCLFGEGEQLDSVSGKARQTVEDGCIGCRGREERVRRTDGLRLSGGGTAGFGQLIQPLLRLLGIRMPHPLIQPQALLKICFRLI